MAKANLTLTRDELFKAIFKYVKDEYGITGDNAIICYEFDGYNKYIDRVDIDYEVEKRTAPK